MEKPTRLADIQRTTSSILKTVNNTRSQGLGIWAFLQLLARSKSILLRQASCHNTATLDTLSCLMISPSCLLPSTLNFSSEKVFLSSNSTHRLMPTWARFHFLYFKTFRFLSFPLLFLRQYLVHTYHVT